MCKLCDSCAIMATLRPLFAQLGAIERSDGSAQISHGRTAAVAAVFGPGDVRAAKVGRTQGYDSTFLTKEWKKEQVSRCCTADVCLRQCVNQLCNNKKMAKLVLFPTACSQPYVPAACHTQTGTLLLEGQGGRGGHHRGRRKEQTGSSRVPACAGQAQAAVARDARLGGAGSNVIIMNDQSWTS